jgi:hypothetical protein
MTGIVGSRFISKLGLRYLVGESSLGSIEKVSKALVITH